MLLALVEGCSSPHAPYQGALEVRMLPTGEVASSARSDEIIQVSAKTMETKDSQKEEKDVTKDRKDLTKEASPRDQLVAGGGGGPLILAKAIELAFQLQPRLRVYLESIQQAKGQEEIAFAPFLPIVGASYSAGGFHLDTGGAALDAFIPPAGAVPIGLDINTGYAVADLKLQWLLCDFGRRTGRYHQAGMAVDIAALQTDRAYQTVALEVATAYYGLLRARALQKAAQEAVRRAQDDLEVARKLQKGGVVEREKVLRAEVSLAQVQRALDTTNAGVPIAVASLNLAIGLDVNAPTCVVEPGDLPPFSLTLCDCLGLAVAQRREFQVARTSVAVAQEGSHVAKADFAPRIIAEGLLLDFQQTSPRAHLDLPLGFIKLEWGLFEGGKRVGELHVADSKIRSAMAQAESIADTIAYQVNEAYHQMVAARLGIERSRPAVEQAQENYRLVLARFRSGDATPTEITDAESALTRAQVDFSTSTYDALSALTRLEYAMGTTQNQENTSPHAH